MKLVFSLVAAATAALVLSTTALARTASFTYAGLWLSSVVRHDEVPPDRVTQLAKELTAAPQNPKQRTSDPENPKPIQPRHTTISVYEQTTKQWMLRRQGCRAANGGMSGVVILDWGKPSYNGHTYGTILFSDRFAGNREITKAMLAYAVGYSSCLTPGSPLHLTLARGTSNYHPSVPSAFKAGRKWARETEALGRMIMARNLENNVWTAAADDAEPAWDPGFTRTRNFFRGYRAAGNGRTLYNFGSLDGGVGAYWTARQLYYVSGGMRYAQVLPEIYNKTMAQQWARLARIVQVRFHGKVRFAGVMTQHTPGCRCSLMPVGAHKVLARELLAAGAGMSPLPWGGSNMGDYRPQSPS